MHNERTDERSTPSSRPGADGRGARSRRAGAALAGRRQTGALRRPAVERARLERDGWRTSLDFVENHRRDGGARLTGVSAHWVATGERDGVVVSVSVDRQRAAWKELLRSVLTTSRSAQTRAARSGQTTATRRTAPDLEECKNLRSALARVE